jgi:hypothetical protein
MGTRTLVAFATAGSAFVIVVSLIAVASLFNDINNFYDDVIADMAEFKVHMRSLLVNGENAYRHSQTTHGTA